MVAEGWADNRDTHLHYLDNQVASRRLPLVFVPGLSSSAEQFLPMLEALTTHRALSVSLRGRGKSMAPDTGYRLEDHIADLAAIVRQAGLARAVFFAHSIGVNYAIGYALDQPERVAGLILSGYPAEYPAFTADWALKVMMKYPEALPMKAVLGIQSESRATSFWERLHELSCPLLVLRGGKESSLLKEDMTEKYSQAAPGARVVVFPASGHRLWRPDLALFLDTIRAFADAIDG